MRPSQVPRDLDGTGREHGIPLSGAERVVAGVIERVAATARPTTGPLARPEPPDRRDETPGRRRPAKGATGTRFRGRHRPSAAPTAARKPWGSKGGAASPRQNIQGVG